MGEGVLLKITDLHSPFEDLCRMGKPVSMILRDSKEGSTVGRIAAAHTDRIDLLEITPEGYWNDHVTIIRMDDIVHFTVDAEYERLFAKYARIKH